ncbi:unnamed protein product [Caenorhabditis auriculariae]|uniref:Uncharacterized protein n=1 Tax=Caenorhabditis auriculariae TaxID=2777116 RepID=A0A8S1GR07_9PELO|nr:unnamed protein product [Caenorhabditis auriculariae]
MLCDTVLQEGRQAIVCRQETRWYYWSREFVPACTNSVKRDTACTFLLPISGLILICFAAKMAYACIFFAVDYPNKEILRMLTGFSKSIETIIRWSFCFGLTVYIGILIHHARKRYHLTNRFCRVSFSLTMLVNTATSLAWNIWPKLTYLNYLFAGFSCLSWAVITISGFVVVLMFSKKPSEALKAVGDREIRNARMRLFWASAFAFLTTPVAFVPTIYTVLTEVEEVVEIGGACQQVVILFDAFILLPCFRTAIFGCCTEDEEEERRKSNGQLVMVAPATDLWRIDNNSNIYQKPEVPTNLQFIRLPVVFDSGGKPEILFPVPPKYEELFHVAPTLENAQT